MVMPLEQLFPKLASGNYHVTSPKNSHYNCIAWSLGDTEKWWWPGSDVTEEFWPENCLREITLDAFEELYARFGYEACTEEEVEPGFEKLALFADVHGTPTHAARQLPSGQWSSKLGKLEDIEHELNDLEGAMYGSVVLLMRRLIPDQNKQETDDETQ